MTKSNENWSVWVRVTVEIAGEVITDYFRRGPKKPIPSEWDGFAGWVPISHVSAH